jgi:hypothetical protein
LEVPTKFRFFHVKIFLSWFELHSFMFVNLP